MLGLAVLFFLGLWVIITIVAMVIGSKFGRKPATKLLGAFLGFMLSMGGLIVYWTIEYYQIKNYVTDLCEKKAGVEVYISPEDFKQRLVNNNWESMPEYTVLPKGDEKNDEYILFRGKEFKGFRADTSIPKITIYEHEVYKEYDYSTIYREELYVFNQAKVALTKHTSIVITSAGIANDLSELKFWISDIDDCKTSLKNDNFNLYDEELRNE